MDPTGVPQIFLYKNGAPLWRAGSWTGQTWSGVPEMNPRRHFIFNASYVNNSNEVTIMYGVTDSTVFSRKVVDNTGHVRRSTWNAQEHRWAQFWYNPKEDCDNFNCGINGICDPYILDKFECKCLPGFKPKYPREWYLGDGSGGTLLKIAISVSMSDNSEEKAQQISINY
ncbi:hypothetical protein L6164_036499 [Bauhinia variegata]|uniref:Uncharacterized protein n=1 Tax=Bauhinia variegata TaxID=167791 RepID=A0ACB9KHA8_BAUVA|nr:hypothetical protein L6164_036499 [Bauhinia variegata]